MTYFAPDSYFNAPLPAVRRIDNRSAAVVAKLTSWVNRGTQPISDTATHTGGAPWLNEVPLYFAAVDTPRERVALSSWLATDQQPLLESVPIPAGTKGDATSDSSVTIHDRSTDTLYEFWKFQRDTAGKLTAAGAGIMAGASAQLGYYSERARPPHSLVFGALWGVQASGFSHAAGLVLVEQVQQGRIPSALALAVPWAAKDWFCHPAQRTDGKDTTASAIPYGALLALPASFSLDLYTTQRRATEPGYTPTTFTRLVSEALRTYGAIPVDQTGWGVGIQVESSVSWQARNPGQPNPWNRGALLQTTRDDEMRRLPWDKLQLLSMDLRRR
jgi:hypothetical protein